MTENNKEVRQNYSRRSGDKFFDTWVKPVLPLIIIGLFTSAVGLWIRIAILESTNSKLAIEIETKASIDSLAVRDERIHRLIEEVATSNRYLEKMAQNMETLKEQRLIHITERENQQKGKK
jgi:hypothetical protein